MLNNPSKIKRVMQKATEYRRKGIDKSQALRMAWRDVRENPAVGFLGPLIIIGVGALAAWKFGLFQKLGFIKPSSPAEKKMTAEEERKLGEQLLKEKTITAAKTMNSVVSIPDSSVVLKVTMVLAVNEAIKKNSGNTRFLQDGLNKIYGSKLAVDGKFGPATTQSLGLAIAKSKMIRVEDKTLDVYRRIGFKVRNVSGKEVPIGAVVINLKDRERGNLLWRSKQDIRGI